MADSALQIRWLRQLHLWAGLVQLGYWFLMAVSYGGAKEFRVFMLPAGITGAYFRPLYIYTGKVNINVLVAVFVLLTWIFHHIESIWAPRVLHWIKTGSQWLRWVEYSFSASVMLLAISMTAGVQDIATLLLTFAAYNSCMMLGGISEWHLSARGSEGKSQAFFFYVLSNIMFVAAWVPIIISFTITSYYGIPDGGSTPAFVYVIVYALLALQLPFATIFTVKMWHMWTTTLTPAEFLDQHGYKYECWYIYMSFVAKSVLAWTVFGSAFQQGDVSALPDGGNIYSEWIMAAFLTGGLTWVVAATTYWVDQSRVAFTTISTLNFVSAKVFIFMTALLAVALEIITICIGIAFVNDATQYGWIAGLLLGIHLGCETLYIPAADKIVFPDEILPRNRSNALFIRIGSLVGYAGFVILCMIEITDTKYQVIEIIFGAIVIARLLIWDLLIKAQKVIYNPNAASMDTSVSKPP